jgi:hypothetical protein
VLVKPGQLEAQGAVESVLPLWGGAAQALLCPEAPAGPSLLMCPTAVAKDTTRNAEQAAGPRPGRTENEHAPGGRIENEFKQWRDLPCSQLGC